MKSISIRVPFHEQCMLQVIMDKTLTFYRIVYFEEPKQYCYKIEREESRIEDVSF